MLICSIVCASGISDSQVDSLRKKLSVHFSERVNLQLRESVLGKSLLVHLLNEHFGIRDFYVDCTKNGKPYLRDSNIHFNISHCNDYILCVCGYENVGCDIEAVRPYNEKVSRRFFSVNEYNALCLSENPEVDFMRMWTLKESALKFSGEGISGGLDLWDFSEYYNYETFRLKGLRFTCRESRNLIISICSTDDEILEIKTDINKMFDLKGENYEYN